MGQIQRHETIATMRGAAAILEALSLIGAPQPTKGTGDAELARIICDHELEIREMVGFVLRTVSESI